MRPLVDFFVGGLLRAIRMIKEAKASRGLSKKNSLTVDLHPDRPDYRGFAIGEKLISLEADPAFEEMEAAGALVDKRDEAHTVLDDFFLISGVIPRVTPYENGLKGAMRFDRSEGDWISDEAIADERFLMCNLKGACRSYYHWFDDNDFDNPSQEKELSCLQAAVMRGLSTLPNTQSTCSMDLCLSMPSLEASI